MNKENLYICAPLQELLWDGDNYQFGPTIQIQKTKPDLSKIDTLVNHMLSRADQDRLSSATHWLVFPWSNDNILKPSEIVYLFHLSMWLVKPTKLHSCFRFETDIDEEQKGKVSRILDRFVWNRSNQLSEYRNSDLDTATFYFETLYSLCGKRGRLNNAAGLTITGCMAYHMHVAFICHTAAMEAILTYTTAPGITKRLAQSYACLTETEKDRRDLAYNEFYKIYNVRSDVMHGRGYQRYQNNANDELSLLAQTEDVMRKLWTKVISSKEIYEALEADDDIRKMFFETQQSGYTPPDQSMGSKSID